ncbi:MAG: EamA family transporter [Salinigranum sp.]
MTEIAYVAGLLAALCWGSSPVVSKRGLSYGGSPMLVTLVVIATGLTVLWGTLLVTRGPAHFVPELAPSGYGVFAAGGLFGTAVGRIANYTGIDRIGASVNSAVVAVNPLFATVLALVFLGELVTATQAVGVVIVVGGIAVLTAAKGGDLSGWNRRELLFPLLGAFAFGAGGVIRRFGMVATAATPLQGAALNETAAFVGIVCYLLATGTSVLERLPIRAYAYFVATGVFGALGLLMMFTGLKYGRVAIVTTLAGTSTLVATAFSYFVLDDLERVTRGVVGGAVLVVVGITLITLT